jgi:hypothetical protein
MANLTATQISELNLMCAGANRALLGTALSSLETRMDNIQVGLFDYRGVYDASVNTYPATGGSGTGGAILKGDAWYISVAGTLGGDAVQIGDIVFANVDTPAQTSTKWYVAQGNVKSTADVPDTTDYRYCTDAEKVVIGNTSNTNSGDQAASDFNHDDLANITGTAAQYNHPTDADMTVIGNTSGTNTGDQVVTRLYSLGAAILSDDDRIVVIGDGVMVNSTYSLTAQPDVPRNITVTHASVGATDTLGIITVDGTDINDEVIQEIITPSADGVVVGLAAFKTVTTITGSGWTIAEGNDTIIVGVGDVLGLPVVISNASDILLGYVGVAPIVPTVVANALISLCTADLATGTYDGSKVVLVHITQ